MGVKYSVVIYFIYLGLRAWVCAFLPITVYINYIKPSPLFPVKRPFLYETESDKEGESERERESGPRVCVW